MANLKAIRKRIVSVKNTQQITKAMKMVAAAKLRRAQESLIQGRPYATRLLETIKRLAKSADTESHPLLEEKGGSKTLLLVITSDRGLCGAFNAGINRTVENFLKENHEKSEKIDLAIVGRKGNDFFKRRKDLYGFDIKYFEGIYDELNAETVRNLTDSLVTKYKGESYDRLYLIYNEFKSAISQEVIFEQLLPISPKSLASDEENQDEVTEYEYEPSQEELLNHLLPLHISTQVFNALRESIASEMGARMTAMESATQNATEMIDKLTLEFNRARQAAITTELIEIISGAEAL